MMDGESEDSTWSLFILQGYGLHHIRKEKSWRPIVNVSVDPDCSVNHCTTYETTLGCSGQNTNQKQSFLISLEAKPESKISIQLLYCPPSKKKSRRKAVAVASCSCTLQELVELHKKDTKPHLVLNFTGAKDSKRRNANTRNAQNGSKPTLQVRLAPPPEVDFGSGYINEARDDDGENDSECVSDAESQSSKSSTHSTVDSEKTLQNSPGASPSDSKKKRLLLSSPTSTSPDQELRKRRKRRRRRVMTGFSVYSDDEAEEKWLSESCSSSEDGDENARGSTGYESPSERSPLRTEFSEDEKSLQVGSQLEVPWVIRISCAALGMDAPRGLLPLYSEQIPVNEIAAADMRWWERVLCTFTVYKELSEAYGESSYERVFQKLQTEWTYVGGALTALAAVDTAVFAISPGGSLFEVNAWAKSAVAASSVATGMGMFCDAWFFLRYAWRPTHVVIPRALDLFNTYASFSFSARIPTLCMFISIFSLMCFLALVAFDAWPLGTLLVFGFVGMSMTLQFLIYGTLWVGRKARRVGMRVGDGVVGVGVGVGRGVRGVVRVARSMSLNAAPPAVAVVVQQQREEVEEEKGRGGAALTQVS